MTGTSSSVKTIAACFAALLCFSSAVGQLVEVPLGTITKRPIGGLSERVQAMTPVALPFWDDFSTNDSLTRADLWQSGTSVFLNNGIGIKPPSKNVVTFDGVDANGKPYNVNDALAKGLADSLISAPIRLDLVPAGLRGTVYLSFYYQVQGRGEAPDAGDQLIVSFKNATNKWEPLYTLENNAALTPDAFYQVLIPVVDDRFYHAAFQFRIQNFARLSGPYDTWNVDYIYLNSGRSPADTSYPDRTVSSALTSLFVDYYAMPVKHFLQNVAANLKHPSLDLFNLRVGNLQPFDYTTDAQVTTRIGQLITTTKIPLDAAQDPGTILQGLQFLNLTLNKIPDVSAFSPLADSIGIKFKFGMSTKDNVLPINNGDYDVAKYSPIDFRFNDSTRNRYVLSSYYAYDDGSAEYGAGLNQAGSYLAFQFPMKSSLPDTLIYVDIYFPDFGNNSSQSLQLQVRSNLSDAVSSILFQQIIQVNRSTKNRFTRYKLDPAVIVKDNFYIGWKQPSSASIPVGLDKNTDNGDKIYYNTNGSWIKNTLVKGSMMVRPGFGRPRGSGPVTSLEIDITPPRAYPNPAKGICYLPARAENITVADLTGRRLEVTVQQLTDATSVQFNSVSGLVILRYFLRGKIYSEKVMVQAE